MKFILNESLENIIYKPVEDTDKFKQYAAEILGGDGNMSASDIKSSIKEIYIDEKLIGYIGFSEYEEDDIKMLGIGNFMVIERGQGYGTKIINDVVETNKDKYDLIYCFVDADNVGAIKLYKKLGSVYDEDGPNDNGQYYVTFYDNGKFDLDESLTEGLNKSEVKSAMQAIYDEYEKYNIDDGNQNCMLCAWALEMQLRGNKDFLPRPVYSPRDIIFQDINGYDIVVGAEKLSLENKDSVSSVAREAGADARFYCHVNWAGLESGHEFLILNIQDTIYIADAQANALVDIEEDDEYFRDINFKNSFLVRLDDKAINDNTLKYNDDEYIIEWDDELDPAFLKGEKEVTEAVTGTEKLDLISIQKFIESCDLATITPPKEGGCYITPSGLYINTSDIKLKNKKLAREFDGEHEGLVYYLLEKGIISQYTHLLSAEAVPYLLNYIRCRNDGEAFTYLRLPPEVLTQKQLRALESWLETCPYDYDLEVEDASGIQFQSYNWQEYSIEDIMRKVRRYYITKKLEEAYDPPYNEEQIKANYGDETYQRLIDDPAHAWRMKTGLELIHKEPSKKELERIWANWQEMTDEQKAESDKKSIELFGKTNAENYNELIKLYESIEKEPELYCISQEDLDGQTLEPRVPDNFFTKNGYEDGETPRVCFAPTIEQCLMGLSQNLKEKEFYVFIPEEVPEENIYKPTIEEVPDSGITDETWITCPVKLKKVGKIKVLGDSGLDGHPFNYGDKTAELYDWDWEWLD